MVEQLRGALVVLSQITDEASVGEILDKLSTEAKEAVITSLSLQGLRLDSSKDEAEKQCLALQARYDYNKIDPSIPFTLGIIYGFILRNHGRCLDFLSIAARDYVTSEVACEVLRGFQSA